MAGCVDYTAASNIYWVIARSPMCGMNGYVKIPSEGHPWSGGFPVPSLNKMDEIPVRDQLTVHGGITLAKFPWLGFSTCHPGDYWGYEFDPMRITNRTLSRTQNIREWSTTMVGREAEKLAKQVAMIGQRYQQTQDTLKWAASIGMSRFRHLDVTEAVAETTVAERNTPTSKGQIW